MLDFLGAGIDLCGFSAADRVIGQAAAYLFVLAGVTAVYGEVMSEDAYRTLTRFGVEVMAGKTVPYIINRTGDGRCPMESAVCGLSDPRAA